MTNAILDKIDVRIADDAPNTDYTAFADFPGEKPGKAALKRWIENWSNDLDNTGYSAFMRHEIPFELQKFEPQAIIDLTGITDPGSSGNLWS